MTTQEIFADLLKPGENFRTCSPEIRPNSPFVRPSQTRVNRELSPNSPNSPPKQEGEIWVLCWTPAGNPMRYKARDPEHALWLQRMNPPGKDAAVPDTRPDEAKK